MSIKSNSTTSTAFAISAANAARRGNIVSSTNKLNIDNQRHTNQIKYYKNYKFQSAKECYEMGFQPTVLVACGSFNPPTTMHLRMLEIVRDHLEAIKPLDFKSWTLLSNTKQEKSITSDYNNCNSCNDFYKQYMDRLIKYSSLPIRVIGGILSPVNDAYKKPHLLNQKHRLELCRLATESSDWINIDPWEASQDHFQRTAWVLDHVQTQLNDLFEDELHSKEAESLYLQPHQPNQLFELDSDNLSPFDRIRDFKPIPPTTAVFQDVNSNIMTQFLKTTNTLFQPSNHCSQCLEGISNQNLNREFNWYPKVKVIYVAGADLLTTLNVPGLWDPRDIETIFGAFSAAVLDRNGVSSLSLTSTNDQPPSQDLPDLQNSQDLQDRRCSSVQQLQLNVQRVEQPVFNDVSSTILRRLLAEGLSIRYLTDDKVVDYIYRHGLYESKGADLHTQRALGKKQG